MRGKLAALAAALLVGSAAPLLGPAGAAQALTCATGSVLDSIKQVCISLDGDITSGTPKPMTTVPPLREPSSVLAAANGSGGTPTENANLAGLNGGDEAGRLALGTRVLQTGTAIVSAAGTGYMIGQGIDKLACNFGATLLCNPKGDPNVKPNTDVPTVGDTGFVDGNTVTLSRDFYSPGWNGAPSANGSVYTIHSGAGMTYNADGTGHFQVQIDRTIAGSWDGFGPFYAFAKCQGFTAYYSWAAYQFGQGQTSGTLDMDNPSPPCPAGKPLIALAFGEPVPTGNENLIRYLPVGTAGRPAPIPADPSRTLVVSNDCVDGSGTHTINTAQSASFTEGADPSTWPVFPSADPCPAGSTLGGAKTVETTSGLPDKTIWQVTTPAPVTKWQQDYPQCGDGSCTLGLWRFQTNGQVSCFVAVEECGGWFTDPNKADNYQCTYGPGADSTFDWNQAVDLSECTVYAPTFKPLPRQTGQPYGDPSTGEAAGDPTSSGSGSGDPSGAPGAYGGQCFPTGWSAFNPAEWVLQPIKCALDWAFIPDESTISDLQGTVQDTLDSGSGLGPWFGEFADIFRKAGAGGGNEPSCEGPTVTFPLTHTDMQPFNACDEPMKTVASVSYDFSTLLIVVFGALTGVRMVSGAFGYNVGFGSRARAET